MLSTLSRRWKRMRLRYIGTDGSLGYRHGKVYDLRIRQGITPMEVEVRRRFGFGLCPYGTQEAFWRNWEPPVAATKAEAE